MNADKTLREIKAYIRTERLDAVVHALDGLGVCQMTIVEVQALAGGVDTADYKYSIKLADKYSNLAKLELVCPADRSERIVEAIADSARLGEQGDGFIFISEIIDMVDIFTRTGLAAVCSD